MNTLIVFAALYFMVVSVQGHGYLLDPPARGSAWRKGFKTPKDYNDMANFCGGKGVQHGSKNNGRCGVCGEEYSLEAKKLEPGPGNIFATGTIVGNYKQGETIDITIQTTAYHKGYYEFRLCENNVPQVGKDSSIAVTSECLNRNLLTSAQSGSTRFTASQGKSTHQVVLPESVSCSACVLQWRYRTGNSWGCENGKCGIGLGPQEEFIGCADIAIEAVDGVRVPKRTSEGKTTSVPITERRPTTQPTPTTQKPVKISTTQKVLKVPTTQQIVKTNPPKEVTVAVVQPPAQNKDCVGRAPWGASMTVWCRQNCLRKFTPYCPSSHCTCRFI